MKIVAYTYEAGHHCASCARKVTQDSGLKALDQHGVPIHWEDSEGNTIGVIFDTEPLGGDLCCDSCGAVLAEDNDSPAGWIRLQDDPFESQMSLALALYIWLSNHQRGQWSKEYKCLCSLTREGMFKPSPLQSTNPEKAFMDDYEAESCYAKLESGEWDCDECLRAIEMKVGDPND